jgi:hypothetical protein
MYLSFASISLAYKSLPLKVAQTLEGDGLNDPFSLLGR